MYKLVAFDAYGTLFDDYPISGLAETIFPGRGQGLALLRRGRQIEYMRRVTMSVPGRGGSQYNFDDKPTAQEAT